MPAADLPITQAGAATHYSRSEQVGTGAGSLPIIAQVVLAGAHKRTYFTPQNLTLTGTAQTLSVPANATLADIYAEGATTNDVARYYHGGTPTSSVGKRIKDHEEISSAAPASFSAINQTGTITLRVEYYNYA